MSDLEKELYDIAERIGKKFLNQGITLQEGHNLYFEAKKKYLSANEKEKTTKVGQSMLAVLSKVGEVSEKFITEWQKGKLNPTKQELILLKEGCDEVEAAFNNHFRKELITYQGTTSFTVHHTKVKEKIKKIRRLIKKEGI